MAEGARFDFGTNIASIADEIASNLTRLEGDLAAAGGKMAGTQIGAELSTTLTRQFTRMETEAEQFAVKMQAIMQRAMAGGSVSGPSIARQLEIAAQQQATAIQSSGSKIPAAMRTPELESQVRKEAASASQPISELTQQLSQLRAASLAAGRSVAETNRMVGSEKSIASAQKRIEATLSQAIKNPLPTEGYRTVYRGETAESRSSSRAVSNSPAGRLFQDDYAAAAAHAGPGGRVVATEVARSELEAAQARAAKLGSTNTGGAGEYYVLRPQHAQAARPVEPTKELNRIDERQVDLKALQARQAAATEKVIAAEEAEYQALTPVQQAAVRRAAASMAAARADDQYALSVERVIQGLHTREMGYINKGGVLKAPGAVPEGVSPYFMRMNTEERGDHFGHLTDPVLTTRLQAEEEGNALRSSRAKQSQIAAGYGTLYEKEGSAFREKSTGKYFDNSGIELDEMKSAERNYARVLRLAAEKMQETIAAGLKTGEFKQVKGAFQDLRNGPKGGDFYQRSGHKIENPIDVMDYDYKSTHQNKGAFSSFVGGFTSKGRDGGAGGAGVDKESLSNLAATAGTVAKYTLMYQALGMVQGAGGGMLAQVKDFTDSYTDLGVAISHVGDSAGTASSASASFVNDLSEIARYSGSNPGEALDAAARGVRAFGNSADAAGQSTQSIGDAVAETTTRLALITGSTMKDVTGDVISVGTAYNLTGQSISQVLDAVAGAKDLGGDPKNISQGMSSFAQNAKAAGYSVKELANLMSLVTARTDEGGAAAAQKLGRIFSLFGSAGNQQFLRGVGVDTTAAVKTQIEELAKVYQAGTPALQGQIRNQFGGSIAVRELLPLLQEQSRLQEANAKSSEHAGRGAEEFFRKSNDLVGTLRKLSGDIKGIQVAMARSDIFAPLGIGLKLLEPALHGLEKMLDTYAKLPNVIKTAIAAMVEFIIVRKVAGQLFPAEAGGLGGVFRSMRGKAATKVEDTAAGLQGRESRAVTPPVVPATEPSTAASRAKAQPRGPGGRFAKAEAAAVLDTAAASAATDIKVGGEALKLGALRGGTSLSEAGKSFKAAAARADARLEASSARQGVLQSYQNLSSGYQAGGLKGMAQAELFSGIGNSIRSGFSSAGEKMAAGRAGLNRMGGLGVSMMALTGATMIDSAYTSTKKGEQAKNAASDLAEEAGRKGGTPEELGQQAADLKTAAAALRESSGGLLGSAKDLFVGVLGGERTGAVAKRAEEAAAFDERQQKAAANALAKNARNNPMAAIDVTSPEGIDKGLDAIARAGGNAVVQFDALIAALDATTSAADKTSRHLTPGAETGFAIGVAGKIRADNTQQDAGDANKAKDPRPWYMPTFSIEPGGDKKKQKDIKLLAGIDWGALATDVSATVNQDVKGMGGDLSPDAAQKIKKDAEERYKLGIPNWNKLSKETQEARLKGVDAAVGQQITETFANQDPAASLAELREKGLAAAQGKGKALGTTASLAGGWGEDTTAQQTLIAMQTLKSSELAAASAAKTELTKDELSTLDENIAMAQQGVATAAAAKIDALSKLSISAMSPFDKSGRLNAELQAIQAQIAIPGQDAKTVAALQAAANDKANAVAQQGVTNAASARTAAVGPFDKVGDAMTKYRNADAQLAFVQNSGATGQDLTDAQKARSDAHVAATQALNEEASSARMAKIDPRDKVGEAAEKLKEAYVQYNMVIKYKGKGKDLADAIRGVNEAKIAAATAAVEDANAFRDANVAIGDKSGALEAKVIDLRALAGTQIGSQRAATLRQAQEAQLAHVQYQSTLSNAIDNSFIDPTSTLEKSRQGVKEATRTLNDIMTEPEYWKDDAYWKARGDLIAKQIEQAQAEAEAASNVRLLSMDMTNPVQMAQEEARKAQEKLARDRGRGAAGDVLVSDEIDVRNKQAAVESAAFSQNLNAATVANTLGRTSHAAYISYLQQQHSNLTQQIAGMGLLDQGRQAAQDRLDQIDQALKGANEQMQGQFNLGQIKVPTVYEVRRSIAAEAGGHTYQDHSVSQVSIAVNGADMVAVKALLESYLGSGLGSRTVSTRKV